MKARTGGPIFRTALFGFSKKDVTSYLIKTANENVSYRTETEQIRENAELREQRISLLEDEIKELKELNAVLTEQNQKLQSDLVVRTNIENRYEELKKKIKFVIGHGRGK